MVALGTPPSSRPRYKSRTETTRVRRADSSGIESQKAERGSVSVLVRGAVARELGPSVETDPGQADVPSGACPGAASVKLSIRMTAEEARRLAAGARAAGLSRGAYLAGLVANVPVPTACGGRARHIEALTASSAELATLSRNIHRLTVLLRQANAEAARPYREILDTLGGDVRRHLELAARVLADLQPSGRKAGTSDH